MLSRYSRASSFGLFWAWSAFVLVPVNFFAGTLLAGRLGPIEAAAAFCLGFVVLCAVSYAPVIVSTENKLTYAQAVKKFIRAPSLAVAMIAIVPLINICWYAIQLALAVTLLASAFPIFSRFSISATFAVSFMFAAGPMFLHYRWLKWFGAIALISVFVALYFSSLHYTWPPPQEPGSFRVWSVASAGITIIGTWIFSSVTCVMDVARHADNGRSAWLAVSAGLFIADILLITLGYISAGWGILSLEDFVSVLGPAGTVAVFVSIWSTNDSNFFSTLKAAEAFGLRRWTVFVGTSVVSALLALAGQHALLNYLGTWLTIMAWLGLPIAVFWLIILRRIDSSEE